MLRRAGRVPGPSASISAGLSNSLGLDAAVVCLSLASKPEIRPAYGASVESRVVAA